MKVKIFAILVSILLLSYVFYNDDNYLISATGDKKISQMTQDNDLVDDDLFMITTTSSGSYVSRSTRIQDIETFVKDSLYTNFKDFRGFTIDSANGLASTTHQIFYNHLGTVITIDSIFISSDMENFRLVLAEKTRDGTKTTIDTMIAATSGYGGWYTMDTNLLDNSIANKSVIMFDRPDSTGKRVYIQINYGYTKQ